MSAPERSGEETAAFEFEALVRTIGVDAISDVMTDADAAVEGGLKGASAEDDAEGHYLSVHPPDDVEFRHGGQATYALPLEAARRILEKVAAETTEPQP